MENKETIGSKIRIYMAVSDFTNPDSSEAEFSRNLADSLNLLGYDVFNQLRNGFDFHQLRKVFDKATGLNTSQAIHSLRYLYHMGRVIPSSDIVISQFDREADLAIKIKHARDLDRKVIEYALLHGDSETVDSFFEGNITPYMLYQCNPLFVINLEKGLKRLEEIAREFDNHIKHEKGGIVRGKKSPDYAGLNPHIRRDIQKARELFNGIQDIHSDRELKEIAERFLENPDKYLLTPTIRAI